jgi:hypothetical protein
VKCSYSLASGVSAVKVEKMKENARIVDVLEDISESTIISFQDSVFRRHELPLMKISECRKRQRQPTSGTLFASAILNEECVKPVIDYNRLVNRIVRVRHAHVVGVVHTHGNVLSLESLESYTSNLVRGLPSAGVYTNWNLPGPGTTKSVDRYYDATTTLVKVEKITGTRLT